MAISAVQTYLLRNKVIASFGEKIDRCQRHSKRWWQLEGKHAF